MKKWIYYAANIVLIAVILVYWKIVAKESNILMDGYLTSKSMLIVAAVMLSARLAEIIYKDLIK